MDRRSRLKNLLSGEEPDAQLIDIGTTVLTGLHADAKEQGPATAAIADPASGILALSPEESRSLGSDFVRAGLLFPAPEPGNGLFTDPFGIQWSRENGAPSPISHPLESATPTRIKGHPGPEWRQPIQSPEPSVTDPRIVMADAPCPGLLCLSLALRNPWRFFQDVAENNAAASALLEWATDCVIKAYSCMLGRMIRRPDIVVYRDELGARGGMYLSPPDFRRFILPHLKILMEEIRRLTPAAVCFHSRGAIQPILQDLADLGIEIFNLDTTAERTGASDLRTALPSRAALHGATDLCKMGVAVICGDKAATARLITELARSAPAIAAPAGSLSSPEQVAAARAGGDFIRHLGKEGLDQIRRYGPVRRLIETAMTDIQTRKE